MPESELEVLVEASLSHFSDSRLTSSDTLSAKSAAGSFGGRFCRGSGTGAAGTGPGVSSVGVSGSALFVGKGTGVGEEHVVGLGRSRDWPPSKLV